MIASNPTLTAYAVASVVLALHSMILGGITGGLRGKVKKVLNREDAVAVTKGADVVEMEAESVARVQRAHRNAIENIVPFFVVGFLYVSAGASEMGAYIYFGVFVAVRLLHSVFYLNAMQPFRTISFAIGQLAILGMAVHVLRVAFTS